MPTRPPRDPNQAAHNVLERVIKKSETKADPKKAATTTKAKEPFSGVKRAAAAKSKPKKK